MRICTTEFTSVFLLWNPTGAGTTWPGYKPQIWVLKMYACCIYFHTRILFFIILQVVFVLRASLTGNYNSSNQLQKRRKLVIVFCLLPSSSYTKAGGRSIIQSWLL